MNKVILMGRLGRDPETKTTTGGSYTIFSLATDESYKDKSGNKVKNTTWHNCKSWNRTGENIAKFFKKGDMILVEGKISNNSWEKDGVKHNTIEVIVEDFEFTSKGKSDTSTTEQHSAVPSGKEDDLPF